MLLCFKQPKSGAFHLLKHLLLLSPFMHRLVRDALNTALQKLGFPWLTPHPTKTSREIGYFQKSTPVITAQRADRYLFVLACRYK
jgi:hypothetical protein